MVRQSRVGVTLLELLVAVAILAVVLGLVLAAVQRVRLAAAATVTNNNLRQIILGVHQLADEKPDGTVGGLPPAKPPAVAYYTEHSVFWLILPYVHGPRQDPTTLKTREEIINYYGPPVACYYDPADPSLTWIVGENNERISYAANMRAFDGAVGYPFRIPDGASSTLAFGTKYNCTAIASHDYTSIIPPNPKSPGSGSQRRATFADVGWRDVVPATEPGSGATVASQRGRTFQVMPPPIAKNVNMLDGYADAAVPQSLHPAGLSVAFFDGSVRTLSPRIDESTFWSLVTPNGNEVLGDY